MHNAISDDLKIRFFDLSLDLLCILDNQGIIQMANPSLGKLLGTGASDLAGSSFNDIVYQQDDVNVLPVLQALDEANPVPQSFVCRILCHDNVTRWCMWTIYFHASGLFHAVGKDITPYKEMENKENERNIFAEALLDTVLAINSSLSLDRVLNRILSNVGKVVAYDSVHLMLVEADHAEVVGVQSRGQSRNDMQRPENRRFRIADSTHLNTMFQTRESLIVPSIADPPVWMTTSPTSESCSYLGAPIVVEDEVIGFLGVMNGMQEYFTSLHAQQLITFANQAGIAIKNARLYEQAETVAVLKERQRMAQELHDSVNQNLFAANTYADLLPKAIKRKPDVVERYAKDISRLIRGAVAQMRMILIELHPDTLTNSDLTMLLKQQCDAFSSHTGIPVKFIANQSVVLPHDDQIAIYRITQESLHNIDKHAASTAVTVTLSVTDSQLELGISDNGKGFDPEAISPVQFGVRGMQNRASSIGAHLEITSNPAAGSQINLRKKYYDQS